MLTYIAIGLMLLSIVLIWLAREIQHSKYTKLLRKQLAEINQIAPEFSTEHDQARLIARGWKQRAAVRNLDKATKAD